MGREEGGKHIQEWVLKLKALNWCPEETTDTPFPSGGAFPLVGMRRGSGGHSSAPADSLSSPTFCFHSQQVAFWEPGITTITYKLFIELKVISISYEEEYEE